MRNYMEVLNFLNNKANVFSFLRPYFTKFCPFACFFQYKKAITVDSKAFNQHLNTEYLYGKVSIIAALFTT